MRLLPALILLASLAAHLAHQPVMAHEAAVPAGEPDTAEHLSAVHVDHDRVETARSDSEGQTDASLIADGEHGPDCLVQVATIPSRNVSPVALTAPASVLGDVEAAGMAERSTLLIPPDRARRHLLLQVLQR